MKAPSRTARLAHALGAGIATLQTRDFGATLAGVQDGVDWHAFERLASQMRSNAAGRRLLREKPRVTSKTLDREHLSSLPLSTLGGAFFAHLEAHDLLRDIELAPSPFPGTPDAEYAKLRWRETHDFRHVLTGLGVSIRDEVVLQAFQLGQYGNRFAVAQMTVGPLLAPRSCLGPSLLRDYRAAYRAGRAAHPLVTVRWESLFEREVAEVRQQLGVPCLGPSHVREPSVRGVRYEQGDAE